MDNETLPSKEDIIGLEDITEVRAIATKVGITFSGNSGIDTLKDKIISAIEEKEKATDDVVLVSAEEEEEEIQIAPIVKNKYSTEDLLKMDPNKEKDTSVRRLIIRAKSMKLSRVKIVNLNPADSVLTGTIVTVVNKYVGKVSKFIPFGDEMENGWHVPEILLNRLRDQTFPLRKEIKNSKFGVKQYKTVMAKKYSIEVLPDLTKEEIEALAQRQTASNAIG